MASTTDSLYVTYVDSFGDLLKIWGQRNRTCATYIEKQLMNSVPEFNRMTAPQAGSIQKGMLCFAKCSDDNYYRARVISDVFNSSVTVLFIDYGKRDRVDLANIRLQNGSTEGVITTIVPQADEFFLANVGSPNGWFSEVLNEIRRDLCYKEYNYTLKYQYKNERFIQINYGKEDYASLLLRRNIAVPVPVTDQALFLSYAFKNQPEIENQNMAQAKQMSAQPGPQMMPKFHPNQSNLPQYITPNPVHNQSQSRFQNNVNQSVACNKSNNTNMVHPEPKVAPILDSGMVEALADQLKQHLSNDKKNFNSGTAHGFVTQALGVGSTYNVCVSNIDDGPWCFSVQLASCEQELNKLMSDISACDLIPIKLPVVLGYPCIAKSKDNDSYCRGVVVNISHSAVKVFFVDFGNTEDLPASSVFELPVSLFNVKTMSQKFALSGLNKIKPSPEIKKAFVEVVENELLLLHVTTPEGENLPTCELYLKTVNIKKILNEKVLRLKLWTPIQLPQRGDVEEVVVTWIDSPQKFYVQLKKNDRDLENLKAELDEWGKVGEFYKPEELEPGALCVCCFSADNNWYRAVVTSINSKNSVTVFYVDFGNVEEVQPSAIKKVGNGLIRQLETQAIQCCLFGFENSSEGAETKDLLETLIFEKELSLRVISTDKDRLVVKLFDKNNDISLYLLGDKAPSNLHPERSAKAVREKPVRKGREKNDSEKRRGDEKSKVFSQRNTSDEKSWRVREERSSRSDVSGDGGLRPDDGSKDERRNSRKDEKPNKSRRYGYGKVRRESENEIRSWRSDEKTETKFEKNEKERNKPKLKPAESRMERTRREARKAKERGMKMFGLTDTRYPVKIGNMALHGSNFKIKHIPVGSVEEVIVTFFVNPKEIYVQLLTGNEHFKKVMDEMQLYYSSKLPIANFPKKGDIVVAQFKEDNVLYRASIINTSPLIVRYVDYGNEEETEKERLWPMDKMFLEIEAQAIKCSLPDLIPNGDTWPVMDSRIDKIFGQEGYSCRFIKNNDNSYEVELTYSEDHNNVRDELISIGFALPDERKTTSQEDIKQCSSMDLTLMRNETFKVYVSHVVDPTEFYVQIERDVVSKIEEEVKNCGDTQSFIQNLDGTHVSNGGIYLANTADDDWKRVKIMEKRDDDAIVQLIDYGDKLDIAYKQIKPIADHLLKYPPQAVQCCLWIMTQEYPENIPQAFKNCDKNIYLASVQDVLPENRLKVALYNMDGEELEFISSLNDAPNTVRPIACLPLLGQEVPVVVSKALSPREVYIQRLKDISSLEELKKEMTNFYTNGGENLEPGEKVCAAKSAADDCWHRAKLLMSANDRAKVFYIDAGSTEDIPLTHIKKLIPSFVEKHAYCRKISLNLDYPEEEEIELTEKLRELVTGKECIGYFKILDNVLYGELTVKGVPVDDVLISEKVKRLKDGIYKEVSLGKRDEEVVEKDFGVFISHSISPSEFWIHHESISNELEILQNMLQTACTNASPKKNVRVGEIVGALFNDKIWYRAMVMNVFDNCLLIQFIDYGNSMKIEYPSSMIIELTEKFVKVPAFASFCSLKGQWKRTAASRFEEIITINQNPLKLIEIEGENPRIVDLLQNGVSVTDQLISEGYELTTTGDVQDDYDVFITHINSPNDFYVQQDGDKSLFDFLISGLLEADLFEDVEDVKEKEIYCAKFPEDEMWYRAKVLKRSKDGAYVHFIDYGNNCSVTEIKMLPQEFQTIQPLSLNCCLLYGELNDAWSEAACKKFKESVSDSALRMEIIYKGAHRNVVKLFTEDGECMTNVLEKLCEPHDREDVCITHINSPSDFYVQRVDNKDFDVIEECLRNADEFDVLEKKEVGELCAVKDEDDIWYRAELRKPFGDAWEIFLIDYGNILNSTQLKKLPDNIKTVKPLAKKCGLDFRSTNISENIKEEFVKITERSVVMKMRVVQPGDCDSVSLLVEGMKVEEVLTYLTSELCEPDVEKQSDKTETGVKANDKYLHGDSDDEIQSANETDEEKREKYADLNIDGFRGDDEDGITRGYGLNLNNPDNKRLEDAKTEELKMVEESDHGANANISDNCNDKNEENWDDV